MCFIWNKKLKWNYKNKEQTTVRGILKPQPLLSWCPVWGQVYQAESGDKGEVFMTEWLPDVPQEKRPHLVPLFNPRQCKTARRELFPQFAAGSELLLLIQICPVQASPACSAHMSKLLASPLACQGLSQSGSACSMFYRPWESREELHRS